MGVPTALGRRHFRHLARTVHSLVFFTEGAVHAPSEHVVRQGMRPAQ